MTPADDDVRTDLVALAGEVASCIRCPLHATRTKAVPGEGDASSDLMFVGEAPGYHEDQQGRPFVGQAGRLLQELLASIGLTREQVFIANVLKCRPPNNRDPLPDEVAACQAFLQRQIELVRPRVICTLGNHATKLLTGNPEGITRVHGRPQIFTAGAQAIYLFPIFHPAAALYTRAMLTTLQEDVRQLPELLERPRPLPGEEAEPCSVEPAEEAARESSASTERVAQPPALGAPPRESMTKQPAAPVPGEQLGLF